MIGPVRCGPTASRCLSAGENNVNSPSSLTTSDDSGVRIALISIFYVTLIGAAGGLFRCLITWLATDHISFAPSYLAALKSGVATALSIAIWLYLRNDKRLLYVPSIGVLRAAAAFDLPWVALLPFAIFSPIFFTMIKLGNRPERF
jgi:hypothetical protein